MEEKKHRHTTKCRNNYTLICLLIFQNNDPIDELKERMN